MVETCCKLCHFAEYNDITQTSCKLGILDKMRGLGVTVDECYDNDREFYVIKDRGCPYHRSAAWGKKHGDNAADQVRNEVRLSFDLLVYCGEGVDRIAVQRTTCSAVNGKLKPRQILFIINGDLKPAEIAYALGDSAWEPRYEYHNVPYSICLCLERTSDGKRVPPERALMVAQTKLGASWMAVFNAGSLVPSTYVDGFGESWFDVINRRVAEDMIACTYIQPRNGLGMATQTSLYRYLGGTSVNADGTYGLFSDKIAVFAAEEGEQQLVKTWEELELPS